MHRIDGPGHVNNRWVAEDPATSRPPTEFTADFNNAIQEEVCSFIEWVGLVLDKNDNTQLRQALLAKFVTQTAFAKAGSMGVQGLSGDPNAAVPGTKYDFICSRRTYFNPTTGEYVVSRSNATISADAALAGPVAGGRDQAAAFTAGFKNLFFIRAADGTESAVWSNNAPSAGPNAVGSYVSWVFGHSAYWTGTAFRRCTMRGARYFEAGMQALSDSGNTSGGEVAINCAAGWPSWAKTAFARAMSYMSTNGSGGGTAEVTYRFISGFIHKQIGMGCAQANDTSYYIEEMAFPNVLQRLYLTVNLTSGASFISSVSAKLLAVGFTVDNGDSE